MPHIITMTVLANHTGRNPGCRSSHWNILENHSSGSNTRIGADMNILYQANIWTNIYIIPNDCCPPFITTYRRELGKIDIIPYDCRRVGNCAKAMAYIKAITY